MLEVFSTSQQNEALGANFSVYSVFDTAKGLTKLSRQTRSEFCWHPMVHLIIEIFCPKHLPQRHCLHSSDSPKFLSCPSGTCWKDEERRAKPGYIVKHPCCPIKPFRGAGSLTSARQAKHTCCKGISRLSCTITIRYAKKQSPALICRR